MLATRDIPLIYIVNDEESVRKGLSRLLRSAGMPCAAVLTGILAFSTPLVAAAAAAVLLSLVSTAQAQVPPQPQRNPAALRQPQRRCDVRTDGFLRAADRQDVCRATFTQRTPSGDHSDKGHL